MKTIHPAIAEHVMEENEKLREVLRAMLDECDPLKLNCGEPWCRARAAISQQAEPADDIPDFTPGNGNKARRRMAALALAAENQRVTPVDSLLAPPHPLAQQAEPQCLDCLAYQENEQNPNVVCDECGWKQNEQAEPAPAQDEREAAMESIIRAQRKSLDICASQIAALQAARPEQTEQQPVLAVKVEVDCVEHVHPEYGGGYFFTEDAIVEMYAAPLAQTAPQPTLPVERLVEGLDEISALTRHLRQGGCDATDLPGLEEGLTRAITTADELLSLLAGAVFVQAAPQSGKVIAYRTLDRNGNAVTDWIDGDPANGEPIVTGGSFQLAYAAPQPEQSGLVGQVCGGDGTHNTVNVAVVGPSPWGDLRIGTPVRLIPAPATPSPAQRGEA